MRHQLFAAFVMAVLVGLVTFAGGGFADLATKKADQWEGTYLKYAHFDTGRQGQFGEAHRITITKTKDGYRLSEPYGDWTFTEIEKGVLSDGKGGLGKIYLGSAEFADGKRVPVLRAEFCYEQFILYGELSPPSPAVESKARR